MIQYCYRLVMVPATAWCWLPTYWMLVLWRTIWIIREMEPVNVPTGIARGVGPRSCGRK